MNKIIKNFSELIEKIKNLTTDICAYTGDASQGAKRSLETS